MTARRGRAWWVGVDVHLDTWAVLGALDDTRTRGYAAHRYAMALGDDARRARRAVDGCFLPAAIVSAPGVDWWHIAAALSADMRLATGPWA